MQKFLCHLIQKTTATFKEKHFIYDVGKEGEPHPPAQPAKTDAPADAPAAPAEGTAKPEAAEENPKALFEALKQKVTSLGQTINQVVGNETYTKGLQTEAQSAKAALAKIQTQMASVKIDEMDMAEVEGFKTALAEIEGDKFQGEKANENIAAKEKITELRAALKQISQESYNAEKVKEAILKTLPEEFPQVVRDAIITRLDNAKIGDLIAADLKILQDMLDNADSETDLETINQRITQVEDEIPTLTVENFIKNSPEMAAIGKQIVNVIHSGVFTTIIGIKSRSDLTKKQKNKIIDQIFSAMAYAIKNPEFGKKKTPDPATMGAAIAGGLPFPLNVLGMLGAGGKAAYDALTATDDKQKTEETPEAAQLRKKQELIDRGQTILDRLAPIINDENCKIYTKGLVDKAQIYLDLSITQSQLIVKNPPTETTMASLEAHIKAVEEDANFTEEGIADNIFAKNQITTLQQERDTLEATRTAEDIKAEMLSEENTEGMPPELVTALDNNFPLEAVQADLTEKLTHIKDSLEIADSLVDGEAIQDLFPAITENLDALSSENYEGPETLTDFRTKIAIAYTWDNLKDLGGEGDQCKAAKAEVLASLVKGIESDDGSYPGLAESEHKILAAYLADFVSEKVGQKVTPQQITGTLMTFSRLTNPKAADKTTKAIIAALQSPELQGKVQFNWKAYTNATPHSVDKSLAEHQKLLEGLDEAEKRFKADTLRVDDEDIAPPEMDAEGNPVVGYRPGKIDAELVGKYREHVQAATAAKPGTKEYRDAVKALNAFVKENEDALCRAGGHFDLATGILRARQMRKAVVGDQKPPDYTNETVYIKITDRKEDIGKSNLKAAGLYFSAPVPPEVEGEEPAVPAEGQPVAGDQPGAPAKPEPPTDAEAPPADAEAPPAGDEAPPAGDEEPPAGAEAPPAGEEAPPADAEAPPAEEAPPAPEAAPAVPPTTTTTAAPESESATMPDGEGERTLPDGTREQGDFADDQLVKGTKTIKNGEILQGTFDPTTGNLIKGKATYSDGSKADGRFDPITENLIEGTYKYSDGEIEKGTFDPTTGDLIKGEKTYPGGEKADGRFDPITRHLIEGTYKYSDGEIGKGTFDPTTGRLIKGKITYPDGSKKEFY